ncbi:MAG: SpoIIE family protein phosphatase, partial [Spirochaetes bacterium]|nr:SpoIIE family protein phosphatase [Spirochaetota bacterium]
CFIKKGDLNQSQEWGYQSLRISEKNKIQFTMCVSNIYLGHQEIEKRNLKRAVKYLEKAKKINECNSFLKDYTVFLYTDLAETYLGEYKSHTFNFKMQKKIKKACKEALKQTRQWANHFGGALRVSAKYYSLIGNNRTADKYFMKSIEQISSIGRKYELAKSFYEFGNHLNKAERKEKAIECWQKAHELFNVIGAKEYIKRTVKLLGITEKAGDDSTVTQQDRLQLERRMTTVLNTSRYLSSILDLDELLEKIMDRTIELVGAERGLLLLYPDKDEGKPIELETRVVRGVKSDESSTFRMSKSILKQVVDKRQPLIIDDASTNAALKAQASVVGKGFKSILCAPIVTKNELLGVIYLDNHLVSGLFKEEDLRILELISSQAGVSIENARLYKKSIIKERIEQDMEIAGTIQKLFLPKSIEVIKKVSIDAFYSPAESIGGDYYDIMKINKDRYVVLLVDISGHGSSAAIVMSVISFIVHSVVDKIRDSAQLTGILNKRLTERLQSEKYATGIVMIYNTKKETIEYTNAGHCGIFVFKKKAGNIEEYYTKDIPVGVMEDTKYKKGSFKFNKGDIILLQTDGIYETMNEKKQQFGLERVKKLLKNYKDKSVQEINQFIMSEVERFKGEGVPQGDDITILTLKKTE